MFVWHTWLFIIFSSPWSSGDFPFALLEYFTAGCSDLVVTSPGSEEAAALFSLSQPQPAAPSGEVTCCSAPHELWRQNTLFANPTVKSRGKYRSILSGILLASPHVVVTPTSVKSRGQSAGCDATNGVARSDWQSPHSLWLQNVRLIQQNQPKSQPLEKLMLKLIFYSRNFTRAPYTQRRKKDNTIRLPTKSPIRLSKFSLVLKWSKSYERNDRSSLKYLNIYFFAPYNGNYFLKNKQTEKRCEKQPKFYQPAQCYIFQQLFKRSPIWQHWLQNVTLSLHKIICFARLSVNIHTKK